VSVDVDKVVEVPLYTVVRQTQVQLPGALAQGHSFGSALKVEFTDLATKSRNLKITLSFLIPAHLKDADLVVMYWDGSKWVPMSGGSVVGNDFVIEVTRPGFYVLTQQ
jgi:hypothetical protein